MTISIRKRLSLALAAALLGLGTFAATPASADINVYSARKEHLIKPLLDAFETETGIGYNLLTADADQLIARLRQEGRYTPADILITTDAGRLHRAETEDLFQPVSSPTLEANVPARYRDPAGKWWGLSVRARVIFYAPDRVDPKALTDYRGLADPRWRDRVCVRSSNNVYNQSLLAAIIAHDGVDKAEQWAAGVVANMARKPQGGDRDQIKAVAAGECDIAVANTYYWGGMLTSSDADERAAAEAVRLFWPGQGDGGRGVHVNVSGAGVTKHAANRDDAIKFLEFLTDREAQAYYARSNHEYPVREDIDWPPLLAGWGSFVADDLPVATLGENNAEAVRVFDRVGWR